MAFYVVLAACLFVFVNGTATTEFDTYGHALSLHDSLPFLLSPHARSLRRQCRAGRRHALLLHRIFAGGDAVRQPSGSLVGALRTRHPRADLRGRAATQAPRIFPRPHAHRETLVRWPADVA